MLHQIDRNVPSAALTRLRHLHRELAIVPRVTPSFTRPLRVCLLTDTLGDVNGVSRFIQNVALQAHQTGRDLRVLTSTQFKIPDQPNIINFKPVIATKMPRYENLELVLPPALAILRYLKEARPDVLHISTPGSVGSVGWWAALRMGIPVLGVYHTDFPAYVDYLFQEPVYTTLCTGHMRLFYKRFASIFTRSTDYKRSLIQLGIAEDRIVRLLPGIDTHAFHTRYKDPSIWARLGVPDDGVKVIYCGRVSVEKNMPLLTKAWKDVTHVCAQRGLTAQLIIVGDGPHRAPMQLELQGTNVHFLGFRHGVELSTIYASGDLFVFPSTTDTLGQVVMESQSSGLPVIVSDQGGPKEVVQQGRTGLVLPADRPEQWTDAIVSLIQDEPRRRQWGAAAHEFIQPMSIQQSFEHFWQVHQAAAEPR
jgi:glycosyltransferase involved in cell wall biosynthesis